MASEDSNVGLWTPPPAQGCPSREMPSTVTVGVSPRESHHGPEAASPAVTPTPGRSPGPHVQGRVMASKELEFRQSGDALVNSPVPGPGQPPLLAWGRNIPTSCLSFPSVPAPLDGLAEC